MGSMDYSEPPKTMCFLSHSSSYDELETKVHAAMDTNADRTRLVLFGRHPMIIPGGQTVFVPIPLTDDQSWKWFLQVASVSQPIHVYATAKRRTDSQSRGQAPLLSPRDNGDEYSSEWLAGLCSLIFNKAVMVPAFSEIFADIFYCLSSILPELCVDDKKEKVIHMRRKRGNIKLIGELYKKRMLTERIMHQCIKKLLGGQYDENPDEEDVETLCHLMHIVGETIDHPKAKEHMDFYFETLSKLIDHPTLSSRLKEMLVHLVDLRENKWQKIGKLQGSKMFKDFHPSS
nr:eukaryotic translation initiation factor 4G-like isoform X2 [Ipomoea batatas]